jgi:hypothetical protein
MPTVCLVEAGVIGIDRDVTWRPGGPRLKELSNPS